MIQFMAFSSHPRAKQRVFWLRMDKNYRRSSFLKSPAPYGTVLTKSVTINTLC